ncbi:esterase/lipase family protein [Nocardiopsis metallicus]|uniref:Pimeloyl-ACP methyl ester carboxylesterase n=1 Tax=Nocardiopsis metallicus TaxID=179819 RepID=A0A840WUT7_9ACTN|nr:hypothetical protein [Nocardiopsis metallicus]MBB5495287.1 pimeloyl-ACP methyl ester carboxylesterase [Nocardiopsis metallicus]
MTDQRQPVVKPFGFLAPTPPAVEPAPAPDATWALPGGTAWVYLSAPEAGLRRPVVLSDGFESGPSQLDRLWAGLERGDYAFVTGLRRRGYDLVLVGYDERSASILRNAETFTAAVLRSTAERLGDTRLTAGGFSMGGLLARYALAKLEAQRMDHQTGVYLSFDSPHRGAWVPIGLQKFAHFLTATPALSEQINSPAARQLLWRHVESVDAEPAEDPMRTEFLAELGRVGSWPRIPRLIGVANGTGNGTGNGVPPGEDAVTVIGGWFKGTTLRTQAEGDKQLVARLKGQFAEKEVRTTGLPALDGVPGGTLETFGIAGDRLKITGPTEITHRSVCFVPSASAVAIGGLDDPYVTVDALDWERSELDDFQLSDTNEPHAHMSPALGEWILDRLPR